MKIRLDVLMTQRNLVESREKARALIMEGAVYVNGTKAEKAGEMIGDHCEITLKESSLPFVSRGGLKLQKAVDVFGIDLIGLHCIDIGASTGGFTDCMLQHGAEHVYSVDVGYGQLHWKLRNDGRVTVMERKNARAMEPDWFDSVPDFASVDVSFISLKLILPPMYKCLSAGGRGVVLIKPQFEAGREQVGKNGVVREASIHKEVILNIVRFARETGFEILGLDFSPITGPKGNIEFLLYLKKPECETDRIDSFNLSLVDSVVNDAHSNEF